MADMMQFDLVSPERSLASLQVSEVQIPGAEGDMTAMPDHAATITTLRPGLLRVVGAEGTQEYLVTGGFAEISATGTSVLAEKAMPREEVTQEVMDALVADAIAARDAASPESMDAAVKLVADISAASEVLGLTVR
ncbi:MAG: F0F1 ATP synthase subunit epsilon [Paracoccaceae bacterium]